MPLQVGDRFPENVQFNWAPIIDSDVSACTRPTVLNASKGWTGKKVVIVSLPGAFTPQCSARHLPGYVEKFDDLRAKGIDVVAFIMYNDPYVAAGWGKANQVPPGDEFLLLSDTKSHFAKNFGWLAPGDEERTGRWAMIVETDGTISYIGNEAHIDDVKDALFSHNLASDINQCPQFPYWKNDVKKYD